MDGEDGGGDCCDTSTMCSACSLSILVEVPHRVHVETYLLPSGMTGMKKSVNHVARRTMTCAAGE